MIYELLESVADVNNGEGREDMRSNVYRIAYDSIARIQV